MATGVEAIFEKLESAPVEKETAPPTVAEVEEPKAPPVEGQPETETPSTEAEVIDDETEPDLDVIPESSGDFAKYKPLYKEHPELKAILGREKAFSELAPNGSFQELKQIVARIPTLDDAESLANQAENHRAFGETFRNNPVEFAESLKEIDEAAFRKLATTFPKYLAESDPAAFSEQARYYVDNAIVGMWNDAQQSNDAEYKAAVQLIANRVGYRGAQPEHTAPANSELERLRNDKKQREQSDQQAAFDNFWGQTDEAILSSSLTEVESTLKKALPNVTPAQLERMKGEVWTKTLETINAQPQTKAQIETFRKNALKGKQSIADHKAIVAYSTGRTKLIIPKVAKAVIDEWTNSVLQINRDKTQKQKDTAARTRDVGTGPQGTTSSAAAVPAATNGKPRTFNDVMNELNKGTGKYAR